MIRDRVTLELRRLDILDFVVTHVEERGRPPTIREIGVRFAIDSPSGVRWHLQALAKQGLLRMAGRYAEVVGVKFRRTAEVA